MNDYSLKATELLNQCIFSLLIFRILLSPIKFGFVLFTYSVVVRIGVRDVGGLVRISVESLHFIFWKFVFILVTRRRNTGL